MPAIDQRQSANRSLCPSKIILAGICGDYAGERRKIMETEKMNDAVSAAIAALYARDPDGSGSLAEFQERFRYLGFMGCWMGKWLNMDIGIEADGYTHT